MGAAQRVVVTQGASHPGERISRAIPADDPSLNVLALGPLTNIACSLLAGPPPSMASITILGSNATSAAKFPPFSPFEFNLTKDRWATKVVFRSNVPLRIAPLDVAKGITLTNDVQRRLTQEYVPVILSTEAARWSARSRKIGRTSVPVWDLVAAFWARHPELCVSETRLVRTTLFGRVEYDAPAGRPVEVLKSFVPDQVWDYFFAALRSHRDKSPAQSKL